VGLSSILPSAQGDGTNCAKSSGASAPVDVLGEGLAFTPGRTGRSTMTFILRYSQIRIVRIP